METTLIVNLKQGKLRGKKSKTLYDDEYFSFQGIPYAKPPLDELRFKSPRPAEAWEGILDATKEGNSSCSKHFFNENEFIGSEDCLFLNIYTQKMPSESTKLNPVMVWIHPGGYTHGSGNSDMYGPDFLVASDVVLVTFNYRLGLLGFINFEDPSLEIPGNAGMRDKVMALKWVQENIAHFNGDPENVTVFAESAGSASVHYLVLSPMAKGLFHRAIMQSGSALSPFGIGKRTTPEIAKVLKMDSQNEKEILNKLQEMTSDEILQLQNKLPDLCYDTTERTIGVVVESLSKEPAFLSKSAIDLCRRGEYNHVPLIIGYNSREALMIKFKTKYWGLKYNLIRNFENIVPHMLKLPKGSATSIELAKEIKKLYFGDEEPSEDNMDKTYMLETDCQYLGGIYSMLRYMSATSTKPIYFYRMSLETRANFIKSIMQINNPGVSHADELGYLFSSTYTKKFDENSTEEIGRRIFVKLWTTFARTGNPNPKENDPLINIQWKPVEKEIQHYLDIGENLTIGVNPERARMQLWAKIYDFIPTQKE